MERKQFRKGAVIFREGDPSGCMYEVVLGRVGVYHNYGKAEEKLLREYDVDQYFGEMGLIDKAPRAATAVALERETIVEIITEDACREYFEKKPARVLMLLQDMSQNLRRTTTDYLRVCEKISELVKKEATE